MKTRLTYIDFDFLHDMVMGNDEFLQNVVGQLLKQLPGEIETLREAAANNDNKRIAILTHHIQSTVSVLGKKTPFFQQLEKLGKMAKFNSHPHKIAAEMDRLLLYKNHLLQEINGLRNVTF